MSGVRELGSGVWRRAISRRKGYLGGGFTVQSNFQQLPYDRDLFGHLTLDKLVLPTKLMENKMATAQR